MTQRNSAPLWIEAAQSLGVKVDFGELETHSVVQQALDLAIEKQIHAEEKTFKIRGRNGQAIPFREVYARIATYIQKFREIGDIAVQYDTTNASLPWAGVRLFLQLAINDNEIYCTILSGMELASELIARSAISESLYLSPGKLPASLVEQARQALLKLYVEVLRFLHYGMKYFDQKTLPRVFNGVLRPAETTVKPIVLTMAQAEQNFASLSRLLDAHLAQQTASAIELEVEKLHEKMSELRGPSQELQEQMQELSIALRKSEDIKVMNWLSTIPCRQHHENARKGRLEGSGLWLLDKKEYRDWASSQNSGLFWLHGIPGSGKTKLTSVVIDELKKASEESFDNFHTAFFYCARDSGQKQLSDPDEVLRSIVRQLSGNRGAFDLTGLVQEVYKSSTEIHDEAPKLEISACRELIVALTETHPAYIVIDALDECDPSRRHELLQAFSELAKSSDRLIKVFISSRDDADIRRKLKSFPNVPILKGDNSEDISRFTSREVNAYIQDGRLLDGFVSEELKADIIHILETKAQGMFLWVSLQLENLSDPQRMLMEEDVRHELGQLPSSLANLYAAACDQIERSAPSTRSIARTTLKWLLCTLRPLAIEEALGAVSVDFEARVTDLNAEHMIGMCRNLIVHDRDQDVLHFAHLSVRDYLEDRVEYAVHENEITAAERCLDVVTAMYSPLPIAGQKLKQNQALKEYATLFWPFHYQNIELKHRHDRLVRKLFRFLFRGDPEHNSFTEWMDAANTLSRSADLSDAMAADLNSIQSDPPTPLFTACVFGLPKMAAHIKKTDPTSLQRTNSTGQSPLSLAMEHGHFHVVQVLLEPEVSDPASKAIIRSSSFPKNGVTTDPTVVYFTAALHAAISSDNATAIKAMLVRGQELIDDKSFLDYAIEAAVSVGDSKFISVLINAGADLKKARLGPIDRVLTRATERGMVEFIESILDQGLDFEPGHKADKLLREAAATGNIRLVKLYLEYGAEVEPLVEFHGSTAFHVAAADGHDDCLKLMFDYTLAKHGVDEAKSRLGSKNSHTGTTALHEAVDNQHFSTAILLLDLGSPYSLDNGIFSAFMYAVKQGNFDLVKAFVAKQEIGVLVNKQEWLKKTSLHWAAEKGYTEICTYLINNGANPLLKDADGNTPLSYAVEMGRKPNCEILLEVMAARYPSDNKSWLNQKRYWTSNYLTTVDDAEILQLLLDAGADPLTRMSGPINDQIREIIDGVDHRFTALQYFIYRELWDCTYLLVEHIDKNLGRKILKQHLEVKDELEGKSALHWAVVMGSLECVRFLLEHEADVDSRDDDEFAPVVYALEGNYEDIVLLLREHKRKGDGEFEEIMERVEKLRKKSI